ncbi:MAG: hypothetical protein ACOYBX_07715 [Mycobacterium sp.]
MARPVSSVQVASAPDPDGVLPPELACPLPTLPRLVLALLAFALEPALLLELGPELLPLPVAALVLLPESDPWS